MKKPNAVTQELWDSLTVWQQLFVSWHEYQQMYYADAHIASLKTQDELFWDWLADTFPSAAHKPWNDAKSKALMSAAMDFITNDLLTEHGVGATTEEVYKKLLDVPKS